MRINVYSIFYLQKTFCKLAQTNFDKMDLLLSKIVALFSFKIVIITRYFLLGSFLYFNIQYTKQCNAQWVDITPINGLFKESLFINQDTGFVIGDAGVILRTFDSGLTWANLGQGNQFNFKKIQYNNNNLCTILGCLEDSNIQVFLQSVDFGFHWDTILLPNQYSESFCYINDTTAIIVGDNIMKTNDNGVSFVSVMEFSDIGAMYGGLLSIAFINDSVGFASGIKRENIDQSTMQGIILKTEDYGDTWHIVFESYSHHYLSSLNTIADENNIIYCADYRSTRVFKSIDGGNNWEYFDILPNDGCIGLIQNTVTSLSLVSEDTCYFAISTTFAFSGPNVYGYQYVYKTTNSFNSWKIQYVDSCFIGNGGLFKSLSDILFINDTIGFAIGTNKILKTINGGETSLPAFNKNEEATIQVFPNPFNDLINIRVLSEDKIMKVKIFSVSGVVLFENKIDYSQNIKIPLLLNQGTYIIEIWTNIGVYYRNVIKF